jgi:hypothetical protein
MELQEACKNVGAVICEFPPDDDECETCGEPGKQLYYIRTCYEVDEGSYHYAECIKAMPGIQEAYADDFCRWYEEQM